MYRDSDLRLFIILSVISNILAIAAFALIVVYHFYDAQLLYRDLALAGLVLSWLFKMQLFLQKIEIMEIRIENLMHAGIKRSKLTMGADNLFMILYFVIFWMTLAAILISYMPEKGWQFHFWR